MAGKQAHVQKEERTSAQPHVHQSAPEIQAYGTVSHMLPLELEELRTNEFQAWFLSEHLVNVPLAEVK